MLEELLLWRDLDDDGELKKTVMWSYIFVIVDHDIWGPNGKALDGLGLAAVYLQQVHGVPDSVDFQNSGQRPLHPDGRVLVEVR